MANATAAAAATTTITTVHTARSAPRNKPAGVKPHRPNYAHIHRNVLPVQTIPLPTLIPHNPLSLVAIALSYLVQISAPPMRPTYNGYFSSATSSIHITDEATQRALWEMGFFGRGNLSRSEPTWLDNQRKAGLTAEENTNKRRNERRQAKLERARKEQEEIQEQLSQENQSSKISLSKDGDQGPPKAGTSLQPHESVREDDGLPSIEQENPPDPTLPQNRANDMIHGFNEWKKILDLNGLPTPPATSISSETSNTESNLKKSSMPKTVRFSPTIEAREFDLSSPVTSPIKAPGRSPLDEAVEPTTIENKEHLQLSMEEAFFLSYGLGVLIVVNDNRDRVWSNVDLLALFRRYSYRSLHGAPHCPQPDDPFLLSYAVYHHYRSMGWVVRSGIKFGVDYLLYNRGPAFSHAEFAVVVLPSYIDPYWEVTEERKKYVERKSKKTWWWLHGINRVQSHVHKHLVLCYVDVPAPSTATSMNIGAELAQYKIRDVNLKRWSPNRERD